MTFEPPPGHLDAARPRPDRTNDEWMRDLSASGEPRERACADLYESLLRVARAEARRRGAWKRMAGSEIDDIAHQASADALMTISRKASTFRGESKFSTWAYKFAIFAVSEKISRHFWVNTRVTATVENWEDLPERFGLDPESAAEQRDLIAAVRQAVADTFTDRQHRVFVALVLRQMPIEELAAQLGCSRNAVYKVMFDARRKLRSALQASGHLATTTSSTAVSC